MAEWIEKTLGEVTAFITKGIPPKYVDKENQDTVCVLNQKCNRNFEISYVESRLHNMSLKKVPSEKMLHAGDVLINSTGTGTAGRVAQIFEVPVPTTIDGHMILIRPTDEIDTLYYGYAIKGYQKKIESLAEGSTGQTEINRQRLQDEIIIRFPKDKHIQKSIGIFLLRIDEKIKNNEQINNNLEQQAQAIYKAWFVDFSAFGGTAPNDWQTYHLVDFLPVITGKKNANVSSNQGKYPFFSCSQDYAWTDEYSFDGSAVLVAGNGDFNVKFYSGKFEAYQRTYVLIPYEPKYTAWLFYAVQYHLSSITSAARGSVIKFITKSNLEDFEFVAPKVPLSLPVIYTLDTINKKIAENRKENLRLGTLRDTLLPKLMSGELDVSDIDL